LPSLDKSPSKVKKAIVLAPRKSLKCHLQTYKIYSVAKKIFYLGKVRNPMLNQIMQYFSKLEKPKLILIACAMIALFGIIDYVTGPELALSIFYLLPIMLVAWLVNRRAAVYISMVGAIVWLLADELSREWYVPPSIPWIPYWNAVVRLGFFVIITYILSALKQSTDREKEIARTDYLTGIPNLRYFYELAETELSRARRYNHPLTMAYLDIDNFKLLNDQFGHVAGDLLLRKIAEAIRSNLRMIDIIARVGGDEFVLLFPETGPDAANSAVERIQKGLRNVVQGQPWPITFSIGVLTCIKMPDSVDAMVTAADRLMYSVKGVGKDTVMFEVFDTTFPPPKF
jgi:diguanylate cyclase (GGDEF)-like protein